MCSNLSNFNYKPQVESCQQYLALYLDCYLRALAVMMKVTCRHMEYSHFNLDYGCLPLRNNGDPDVIARRKKETKKEGGAKSFVEFAEEN